MRATALGLGLGLAAASTALADQAADIALHAGGCWSIPGGLETPPSAEFDVVFDKDGNVTDATVVKYSPSGEQGKQVALSATRALQMCSPYKGVSGTVRVTMDPKVLVDGQKAIDPFK